MAKNFTFFTLEGTILREIREEGESKGLDWRVPRLFVTRNEKSEENIQKKLEALQRKDPHRNYSPTDAEALLLFSVFKRKKGQWRRYTRSEAEQLKKEIKEARGYA